MFATKMREGDIDTIPAILSACCGLCNLLLIVSLTCYQQLPFRPAYTEASSRAGAVANGLINSNQADRCANHNRGALCYC